MQPHLRSLDDYVLLGRSGLRVSPLCLGTMTFGEDWGWGSSQDDSKAIFDKYLHMGGNFIDTANLYTGGTSESFIGGYMQGRREQIVLATKFTLSMRHGDPNAGGNGRKNMVQSVNESLQRLKTDFIDLLYAHAWDEATPMEELMRGFDDLVRQGKVLYVALSDFPAWKVAEAQTMATLRGYAPVAGLQIEHSLVERTVERELIPAAKDLGLAVLPWSPLAGGVLSGKYTKEDVAKAQADPEKNPGAGARPLWGKLNERNLRIADVVKEVAADVGATPSQVALRWLIDQRHTSIPIIGARTMAHLEDNLAALAVELTPDHIRRLNEVSAVDLGFPRTFLDRVRGPIIRGETKLHV